MDNKKRLIDARFLTSQMYMICEVCQTENIFIDAIIDEIDNAPDVDAVEVVHGRWIEHPKVEVLDGKWISNYECSECCCSYRTHENYCGYCGAKMDGDGNGS